MKGKWKGREAYFLPRQFRGPVAKGCSEALTSFAYSAGASGSQRSGAKASGSWKLDEEWWVAYWLTATEVCVVGMVSFIWHPEIRPYRWDAYVWWHLVPVDELRV